MSGNRLKQCLIFGDGIKSPDHDQIEKDLYEFDNERDFTPSEEKQTPSAYVQVFETMVRTILECESDLLSLEEVGILEHFKDLCYNARYCLIRLILRTSNRWYPTSSLESFKKEVGEDGLKIAIEDLCSQFSKPIAKENNITTDGIDHVKLEPEGHLVIKQEDTPDIIDLCMDSDDEKPNLTSSLSLQSGVFDVLWPQLAGSGPPLPQSADPIHSLLASDISTIFMDSFCQNESVMTTREILDRINREQLVMLAKEMKCALRSNSKKDHIIDALERQAASQQVLDFGMPSTKGKSRADGLRQTQISFLKVANLSKPKKNQEQRLRELAVKHLGPCVRVNIEFHRLVRRLHIIYFRETEHPTDVLLPALLSTFKKRNFTPVTHKRTSKVWASRTELLQYERALELDKLLDEMEEESISKRATKTPAPRMKRESFTTPVTPGSSRAFSTPLKTPSNNNLQSTQPKSDRNPETNIFENIDLEEDVIQTTREQRIKKHFDDWVYPGWQELVAIEDEGVRPRPIGLERFDAGHVYTRMVHKALKVVAKLKDYNFELKVLEALLEQRFWCRGKRAKWHTRRAIVLGHLVTKEKDLVKKRDLHLRILEGVKEALLDDDTGIVHRPNLVKRLQDLEKKLKIPLEERSQCSGELRQAPFINIKAIRVQPQSLDAQGCPINDKENTPELHKYILITKKDDIAAGDKPRKQTGKSSWQGKGGQVINVETRALEHYQDQGYKGFHCETRILTMLFGLLFWDIIFAEVLGAFETPYQTAPLDLFYDSFYRARKEGIDERLQEIQDGKAREILEKHDKAHRDYATICVGVNWEVCSREDLLDIVDCIGGQTLSIICQIFCEDYDGRRSGGPDLFVWNIQSQKCKFVEVKGPGDTPQENQKLWFDSLLRANANVEICYVKDSNTHCSSKKHRKSTPSSSTRKRSIAPKDDPESEDQDYDKLDCQHEVGADLDELPTLERPNKRPRTGSEQKFEFSSRIPDSKLIQTPSRPLKPRTSSS